MLHIMTQKIHPCSVRLLPAFAALVVGPVPLIIPALAQPATVPPPIEQLGADCARPQYVSDTLVCADTALRALDADVARLSRTPPALAGDALWEPQAAWMRRRSLCAFRTDQRACLAAAYADRRAVLMAGAAPGTRPLRCDGPWRGRDLLASIANAGQAMTIIENGAVLAVATPLAKDWQPWLAWRKSGGRIILQLQAGAVTRCRLS
jgi:uncharacterized protein